MIATALARAQEENRQTFRPFDALDLAAFGLRRRGAELVVAVPRSARFLMAWGGLLGGVILGLTVLTVPARFDPQGYSTFPRSWYASVSALWLMLAVVVVIGRSRAIRLAVCSLLGVCLGAVLFGGSDPRPIAGPLTAEAEALLAQGSQHGPAVFVLLPLAVLACFCLDAAVLAATARWLRIALIGCAVVAGLIFGSLPSGFLFVSTPPSLPPIARAVLVLLGLGFIIAVVFAPSTAPAVLLMALPWLLPANLTIQNAYGEHQLLPSVLAAPATVLTVAVAANLWRLRSRMISGTP